MSLQPGTERVRIATTGILLLLLAVVTYGMLRLTFGPRPVYVHVRWAPHVDDVVRQRLETNYKLTGGEPLEGRTRGYALVDLSRNNIRALVMDPAVEDTHQIHRTAFRVGYFAPRLPYPVAYPSIPVALEVLTALITALGFVGIAVAGLEAFSPAFIRRRLSRLRETFLDPGTVAARTAVAFVLWIRSRIPPASPEAVALFRIAIGAALVVLVVTHRVGEAPAADRTNALSDIHDFVLQAFRAAPWLTGAVVPWVVVWGAVFIAGAFARVAFAMTTIGVFAWAVLYTGQTTYHTVSALLAALVCLLWSRWSDAWSVDAWRRAPSRAPSLEYGYTVWVPGLVLGVVLLAAAVAKIRDGGIAWILNGTVKYHFLSDSGQAMVDWGLRLGQYPAAAVLASFAAIAIESLVIVGVLSRRYLARLAAGIAALSLLTGFALLQGLRWYAWWVLLLSFLPWHLVKPSGADPGGVGASGALPSWRVLLRPAAVTVLLALLAQQAVVSLFRLEMSPLVSSYDMYSTTYASPEDYERKANEVYWIVATDKAGQRHECRITRVEADLFGAGPADARAAGTAGLLRRCFGDASLETISVEVRRVRVDWNAWRLEPPARIPVASITPPS